MKNYNDMTPEEKIEHKKKELDQAIRRYEAFQEHGQSTRGENLKHLKLIDRIQRDIDFHKLTIKLNNK